MKARQAIEQKITLEFKGILSFEDNNNNNNNNNNNGIYFESN